GASGAWADNDVEATVLANVGGNAAVEADDITIEATGKALKQGISGNNVKAGSGGVIDASAAKSETTVEFETAVNVEPDASLHVTGDWRAALEDGRGIVLEAENIIRGNDKVKLDAGGALAIARAKSLFNAKDTTAAVNLGRHVELDSAGLLTLAASSQAD